MTSTTTDRLAGAVGSLASKAPVRVATTTNITLSGLLTVDDIVLAADDRVLVKNQTDGIENGIYDVTSGAWTRTWDWNGTRDIAPGTFVVVAEGTAGAGTFWYISTTGALTIGTTSITLTQMTVASASAYAATLLDDADAEATRLTLGFKKGTDVVSATALDIVPPGNSFDVTGTTTVTSIITWNVGDIVHFRCTGVMTWTHHATNLILPNGLNITTTAGDELMFLEYAAGTWRCISYMPAVGTILRGQGTDRPSASPLIIADSTVLVDGSYFDVTGTTGFSAMTVPAGLLFFLQFDGALTITHGASIDLPGETSITTAAGDRAVCFSTAANTVQVLAFHKANGTALVGGDNIHGATAAFTAATSVDLLSICEAGYDYEIVLDAYAPTTDSERLWMRLAVSDAARSTAGDYEHKVVLDHATASLWLESTSDTEIEMGGGTLVWGNDATNLSHMVIRLFNPMNTDTKTIVTWEGFMFDAAALMNHVKGSAYFLGGTDAITGLEFRWHNGSTFKAQGTYSWRKYKRS